MLFVRPCSQHPLYTRCVFHLIALSIFATTGGITGCATSDSTRSSFATDTSNLVWPAPPEQPRIKFVRTLHSEDQIVPPESGLSSFRDSLLGKPTKAGRQLKKPYAVHADNKGRVFVADSGWGKVLVFDENNKAFSVWGTNGNGLLTKPLGLTSDSQGNVYVTDSVKQRVVVFDPNGEFLTAMGKKGELTRPVGIAVDDERNRVYVVDSKAHHIVVYSKTGELIEILGKRGTEPEEFNWPTNIALDKSGNLYITDSMNFRVQILKPDGTLHKVFGENGDGRGQFVRAKGIAVNSLNHIYVTDAAFNNIQIFNNEGQLLLDVGTLGNEPGQFVLPAGLYIDQQDRIYVADQYNFRIQVFDYLETEKPEMLDKNSAQGETATPREITKKYDLYDQEEQS
ncbi:MAG: 6-bladed beta-propeller [Gammaproteobacteria bacterium]|nr:6-bladed beta-propeller [Gammaproteobacteria bacterium]